MTTNFWADKVLGGMSFVAGTVISESLWAAATFGGSLATAPERFALKEAVSLGLKNQNKILNSFWKSQLFSLGIGLIHALGEMIIVSLFFFGFIGVTDTSNGFFYTVFLLVGVGTLVHSLVDFFIAQYIWKAQESRLTTMKLKIT